MSEKMIGDNNNNDDNYFVKSNVTLEMYNSYYSSKRRNSPISLNRKIRRLIFHYVNGFYSGIPHCCNLYFCKHYWRDPKSPASWYTIIKRNGYTNKGDYVTCDSCFYNKRSVDIRKNGVIMKWLMGNSFNET